MEQYLYGINPVVIFYFLLEEYLYVDRGRTGIKVEQQLIEFVVLCWEHAPVRCNISLATVLEDCVRAGAYVCV